MIKDALGREVFAGNVVLLCFYSSQWACLVTDWFYKHSTGEWDITVESLNPFKTRRNLWGVGDTLETPSYTFYKLANSLKELEC